MSDEKTRLAGAKAQDKQARENHEPEEMRNPVPLPLLIIFIGIISWGASFYFRDIMSAVGVPASTGDRRTAIVVDPNAAIDGATVYSGNCAACHQSNGAGLPGVFPPLAGSEWVLAADSSIPVQILLHGLSGPLQVGGTSYSGVMPAFGQLQDGELAAVLSYLRASWGNNASPVTVDDIATARKASEYQSGAWTEERLRAQVGEP